MRASLLDKVLNKLPSHSPPGAQEVGVDCAPGERGKIGNSCGKPPDTGVWCGLARTGLSWSQGARSPSSMGQRERRQMCLSQAAARQGGVGTGQQGRERAVPEDS